MSHTQTQELVKAHTSMVERVQRYGLYWNAVSTVDIRQRTYSVHNAFREITSCLKQAREIMDLVRYMPGDGLTAQQRFNMHRKMLRIHEQLDLAWNHMTMDPVDGRSCMSSDWNKSGTMGKWRAYKPGPDTISVNHPDNWRCIEPGFDAYD